MNPAEIQNLLHTIASDASLRSPDNFVPRNKAIDDLDFYVLDAVKLGKLTAPSSEWILQAEALHSSLTAIDEALFAKLRRAIRDGELQGDALKLCLVLFVPQGQSLHPGVPGYDNLDHFINGLLISRTLPPAGALPEPDMVFYQQTPARIILELASRANFTEKDIFYDLGSGLGHVPILVHLLTGVKAIGIEYENALDACARACARELKMDHQVTLINMDVRAADLSDGTVFYLYTPFKNRMWLEVLEKLNRVAAKKQIRIFTYGPCTLEMDAVDWLRPIFGQSDIYRLAAFESCL